MIKRRQVWEQETSSNIRVLRREGARPQTAQKLECGCSHQRMPSATSEWQKRRRAWENLLSRCRGSLASPHLDFGYPSSNSEATTASSPSQ